jgi:hypothetical protein
MMPLLGQTQTNWEWAASGADPQHGNSNDVATDGAGNVYVTGAFTGTLSIGSYNLNSAGNTDIFVVKFDVSGQLLWVIREGGIGEDRGFGIGLDVTGNVYVCGNFSASVSFGTNSNVSAGEKDIMLLKYDNDGNLLWSRTWGGIQTDVAQDIKVTQDHKVYITGHFEETVDFQADTLTSYDTRDMLLMRLDTSGVVNWAQMAGGLSSDYGRHVTVAVDGSLYVTGTSAGYAMYFGSMTLSNAEMFIAHYDSNGNILWAKGAEGMSNLGFFGNSAKCDGMGNVFAVGFSQSAQDLNFGNVTLPNSTNYIAKYNSSGTLQWAKHVSEMPTSAIRDLVIDTQGNIYITGYMGTWGIFGNDTIYTNGGQDVWVAKLDNNGNHLWSALGGGAGADGAYALALDNNGSIVTTGYIASSTASFGPYTVNGGGGQDMFVAKLSQTTGLPTTGGKDKQLYIYPNPANDMLYIQGIKGSKEYRMMNVTGALVKQGLLNKNSIDISGLPAGMYLLYAGGEVHKIVKE